MFYELAVDWCSDIVKNLLDEPLLSHYFTKTQFGLGLLSKYFPIKAFLLKTAQMFLFEDQLTYT